MNKKDLIYEAFHYRTYVLAKAEIDYEKAEKEMERFHLKYAISLSKDMIAEIKDDVNELLGVVEE
jgi:hypothetical protein